MERKLQLVSLKWRPTSLPRNSKTLYMAWQSETFRHFAKVTYKFLLRWKSSSKETGCHFVLFSPEDWLKSFLFPKKRKREGRSDYSAVILSCHPSIVFFRETFATFPRLEASLKGRGRGGEIPCKRKESPTNNATLINFLLISDAENLLISTGLAYALAPNTQKLYAMCALFRPSFHFAYHCIGGRAAPSAVEGPCFGYRKSVT